MDHTEFRAALKELNMSQGAFSRETGTPLDTVSKWANNVSRIPKITEAYLRLRQKAQLISDEIKPRKLTRRRRKLKGQADAEGLEGGQDVPGAEARRQ